MRLSVLSCEDYFLFYDSRDLPVLSQRVSFNLSEGHFYRCTFFRSDRRHFSRPEFLGHWKASESNKQDVGEKMKRTPDRRAQKLRINAVAKSAIVSVRGALLKSRSGVVGALNEATKQSREI
jgi:hypothetical protein